MCRLWLVGGAELGDWCIRGYYLAGYVIAVALK